jgi:hypothetical protein
VSNSKISALTSASTPVAGTEVLPIVQSSATVKLAISDITPGLSTITAAKGGTGQTSYAVGDLLYANTTTTLAKLADVATGNALISGGVNIAPSWGKIGLTTHVSGTLPTANGGTNLTSFTANGVVYASSSSALATGNTLVFDGTNLMVGDTTSAGRVLAKSATSDGTTSSYVAKNSSNTILLDIISTGYFKTGVAGNSPYNNASGSGANMVVGSDGALFRSTSSLKYKTDVQDATFGIADVLKLRAVTYKGKGLFDGDKVFAGLIAEEVHDSGLTQFVQYADDGSPDALSYGNMVSLCIKAIQELNTTINTLTARVWALENKG